MGMTVPPVALVLGRSAARRRAERNALQRQQRRLGRDPVAAGVAAEAAGRSDDAVAGDDDRDRVRCTSPGDGPRRRSRARRPARRSWRCRPRGSPSSRCQTALAEGAAAGADGNAEADRLAVEVPLAARPPRASRPGPGDRRLRPPPLQRHHRAVLDEHGDPADRPVAARRRPRPPPSAREPVAQLGRGRSPAGCRSGRRRRRPWPGRRPGPCRGPDGLAGSVSSGPTDRTKRGPAGACRAARRSAAPAGSAGSATITTCAPASSSS